MVADGFAVPPSSRSLTLHEAALTWGSPDLLAELQRLDEEGASKISINGVLGREEPSDRWHYPYLRTLDMLRAEIIGKLQAGALIATGFEEGMPADAPPKVIQAERWHVLRPDFETSSASGTGLTLSSIRVTMRVSEVLHEGQDTEPDEASSGQPTLIVLRRANAIVLKGHRITLSNLPFSLIYLLAKAAVEDGRVVARRDLEQGLWGTTKADGRVADVVHKLRSRIAVTTTAPDPDELIVNRQDHGYMLTLPASEIRIEE